MSTPVSGTGSQPHPPLSAHSRPIQGERKSSAETSSISTHQDVKTASAAGQRRGTLVDILV